MGAEIVKYNNDLNKMPMPKFTGRQYDLFFSIISMIKEKNDNTPALKQFFDPDKRQIIVPYEQFLKICRAYEWNRSFTEVHNEIKNFLDILLEYKISYETKTSSYAFVCFEEAEYKYDTQSFHITFQKRFYDMVVNYSLGFTRFELAEFISLDGKYTKTLYRLLKQYRSTGIMKMKWDEFKDIMDIPKEYRQCDLDLRILKPAIKELTKERTLFDTSRVAFQNLQYEKIKEKGFGGRGQGGKIVGIQFTFTPEVTQSKTTIEQQTTPTQSNHSIQQSNTGNYAIKPNNTNGKDEKEVIKKYDARYRHTKVNYNGETLVIRSVSQGNNGGLSVHFKEFEKGIDKGNMHFNSIDDLIFFIQDNQ